MNWQAFINTKNGYRLKRFFMKLNREVNAIPHTETVEGGVLLLNTRKGYWMYKIFEKNEKKSICPITIRSDRYAKKLLNFTSLNKKVIYLVDDTLNRGFSLMETYELLARHLDSKYICPLVFALRDTVDLKANEERETDAVRKEFWRKLSYFLRMPQDEMGKFCLDETELIHAEGIPFVVDLPYLRMADSNNSPNTSQKSDVNFSIKLTPTQFEAIQRGNETWKFHLLKYEYGTYGGTKNPIEYNGFICQMNDIQLLQETETFVHDFIIEGTYQIDENGDIHAVFIPFAIVKSMNISFLERLWSVLFSDFEDYTGASENIYRRKFREVVFLLSMMTAQEFCKYLRNSIGLDVAYDYTILREHFTEKFIKKTKKLEEKLWHDKKEFREQLGQIRDIWNLSDAAYDKPFSNYEAMTGIKKMRYSEQEALILFSEAINCSREKAAQSFNDSIASPVKDSVLTFESVQRFMRNRFCFDTPEQERLAVTSIVIMMLNLSICSNKLVLDKEKNRMVRGFRYGENSDLIIPFFNVYFYWAILLLEMEKGVDGAYKDYPKFVAALRDEFMSLGLLASENEERTFKCNVLKLRT